MLLIPAVERQQQEGQEFKVIRPWLHREASLGYETLSQKSCKEKKNSNKWGRGQEKWGKAKHIENFKALKLHVKL